MRSVNIHEAKTNLSKLVADAAAGQETVIARAGQPIAKLVPFREARGKRKLGVLVGKLKVAADFDAALPGDVLDSFES